MAALRLFALLSFLAFVMHAARLRFAAFFVVAFTLSWLLMPHPRAWRPFILAASYFFYGWVDWRWVLLLIASSVVNTVAAQVIARSPSQATRKRALITAVVFDLGLLAVFKYLGFFVSEVDGALDSIGLGSPLPLLQIVLPIGISFFTFQAISYVVDVYRGIIAPGLNLSLDALVSAAAKLPRIAIEAPATNSAIGRTTGDQMLIGIYWGYVAMMEGLVERMKAEIGRPVQVIATGGLATLFDQHSQVFDAIEPDLTIQGLALLYKRSLSPT